VKCFLFKISKFEKINSKHPFNRNLKILKNLLKLKSWDYNPHIFIRTIIERTYYGDKVLIAVGYDAAKPFKIDLYY